MLFAHTLEAVLDGTKTQTRRLVKPGHRWMESVTREVWHVGGRQRLVYRVGNQYAVQPGRGIPAVAKIEITDIRHLESAAFISREDAIAEGFGVWEDGTFNPVQAFLSAWRRMHGERRLTAPVWALTFRLVPESLTMADGAAEEAVADAPAVYGTYARGGRDDLPY